MSHKMSALQGIVPKLLRAGISEEAVDEIDRLLTLLRAEGWAGLLTADEALAAVLQENAQLRKDNKRMEDILRIQDGGAGS